MTITIDKIKIIDSEKQLVRCTLSYNGIKYQYPTNTIIMDSAATQVWLELQEERITLSIMKRVYPDANHSSLDAFELWVLDNPDIEPVEWTYTHPTEKMLIERLPNDAIATVEAAHANPTIETLSAALAAITSAVIS